MVQLLVPAEEWRSHDVEEVIQGLSSAIRARSALAVPCSDFSVQMMGVMKNKS